MASIIEFETSRLRMRQWRESDRAPFAAMNADPAVMEVFASPPAPPAGDASIDAWQAQFATEAARAALRVAFERLSLSEIVSFTAVGNLRSRAVMERVGMRNTNQDFEYPGIVEGHPLRLHYLYCITRAEMGRA